MNEEVERGVEIPKSLQWTITNMKVGDSIGFPLNRRSTYATYMSRAKKETTNKYITRKIDSTQGRLWRIE